MCSVFWCCLDFYWMWSKEETVVCISLHKVNFYCTSRHVNKFYVTRYTMYYIATQFHNVNASVEVHREKFCNIELIRHFMTQTKWWFNFWIELEYFAHECQLAFIFVWHILHLAVYSVQVFDSFDIWNDFFCCCLYNLKNININKKWLLLFDC